MSFVDFDILPAMSTEFQSAFVSLKAVFAPYVEHLQVLADTPTDYLLHSRIPSPFKQHKGQPMYFGSVRLGKAYVAFHLMPLYMNDELTATISPALKKRMQGKTCFNFKGVPEPEILAELKRLAEAGFSIFRAKEWI